MKEIKNGTSSNPSGDMLSAALSAQLSGMDTGSCMGPEEMAALVEGRVEGEEKDHLMKHLSACDECWQTFLLTSRLHQENVVQMPLKKPMWQRYKPLALAASVLVMVLFLYVFYKSGGVPAAQDAMKPPQEIPIVMEKDSSGAEEKKSELMRPKSMEPETTQEKEAEVTGSFDKSLSPPPGESVSKRKSGRTKKVAPSRMEDSLRTAPAKPTPRQAVKKSDAKEGMNRQRLEKQGFKAAAEKGKGTGKVVLPDDEKGRGVPVEQERLQEEPATLTKSLQKKNAYQSTTRANEEEMRRKAREQRKQDEALKREKMQRESALAESPAPVSQPTRDMAGKKLSKESSRRQMSSDELKSIFNNSLNYAQQVQMPRKSVDRESKGLISKKQAQPVSNLQTQVVFGEGGYASPDISWFAANSIAGSVENRFFNLANYGWCDDIGICYGGERNSNRPAWVIIQGKEQKINRQLVRQLLTQWKQLQPQLEGVYAKIATKTIATLDAISAR